VGPRGHETGQDLVLLGTAVDLAGRMGVCPSLLLPPDTLLEELGIARKQPKDPEADPAEDLFWALDWIPDTPLPPGIIKGMLAHIGGGWKHAERTLQSRGVGIRKTHLIQRRVEFGVFDILPTEPKPSGLKDYEIARKGRRVWVGTARDGQGRRAGRHLTVEAQVVLGQDMRYVIETERQYRIGLSAIDAPEQDEPSPTVALAPDPPPVAVAPAPSKPAQAPAAVASPQRQRPATRARVRRPPKASSKPHHEIPVVPEKDMFADPETINLLGRMAHNSSIEALAEDPETPNFKRCRDLLSQAQAQAKVNSYIDLMLVAVSLGHAKVDHVPPGKGTRLEYTDMKFVNDYFSPDAQVRDRMRAADADNSNKHRWNRIFRNLGIDIDAEDRLYTAVLYLLRDRMLALPKHVDISDKSPTRT